jgi:methyltransferase
VQICPRFPHEGTGEMFHEILGLPQLAALLILAQRGLEELYSRHNTRRLLRSGACEAGRDFYLIVATTHLCWIAALALLVPPHTQACAPLIAAYLALQALRYWVITTLGRYWTHRILTLPGAPIVTRGPYRLLRHPNYAVTLAETLLLPLAFGQVALGLIFAAMWGAVLQHKIRLEDRALAARRALAGSPP